MKVMKNIQPDFANKRYEEYLALTMDLRPQLSD